MMITDSMADGHQMNKQNKTIKQLAAVSSCIHWRATMEIISPADNQNYKGKYIYSFYTLQSISKAANHFFEDGCRDATDHKHTAD